MVEPLCIHPSIIIPRLGDEAAEFKALTGSPAYCITFNDKAKTRVFGTTLHVYDR
jgi:hypothetical protein